MAKQLAFYVDINKCSGCKACQIACKDRSNLPVGVRWRKVFQYEGGEWVDQNGQMIPSSVYTYSVSSACMHCKKPICMDVCPTSAISKRDDGIVLINADMCIGCRYCSWACPYGAPQFNEELNVMTKCDMCQDLVDKGERPACVESCPYRAMDFGPLDEIREKYGTFADPAPLPDPAITEPAVVYKPNKVTKSSRSGDGRLMNLEEL
ncbi:MAG: dimethylsulfoxide reductase subunit B [Anaerolineales bacterium]|nr:MAG: dimethylsulfoxide reductase subunit B [Chloroflexota bacterium]MBE7434645.1 dimethylsulfoxide reductase subunit B [Anaerolineales bacterium]MCE7859548.1 dimethylsulfoxide reductase subunit B [Chloroflexi bacterium CFX2]